MATGALMNHSTGSLKSRLRIATVAAAFFPACTLVAQNAFHVTFGTTGEPESRYADGAGFVTETDSGDIVVAGSGASYHSDDGIGGPTYPLVARFTSRGELEWQRVYKELENQGFTAVLAAGEEQYVLLREDRNLRDPDRPSPISLRRIDQSGGISESLGELGGYQRLDAIPVAGSEPYFLVVAVRNAAGGASSLDVKLLRFDLRATVTEQGSPAGIGYLWDLQHVGGGDLLFSRWRLREPAGVGGRASIETEIVRMRPTGEVEVVATIPDRLCRSLASSPNRVFCASYSPGTDEPDVLVAHSTAGPELWRHDLEPGVRVEELQALESGDLVYSYFGDMGAIAGRLSASGDLLWTRRLRSTGPYTFLAGIEPLRDGRLALFGSTGPFGAYVSTDTNAMLVVTGVADGDVSTDIASIVVGSP